MCNFLIWPSWTRSRCFQLFYASAMHFLDIIQTAMIHLKLNQVAVWNSLPNIIVSAKSTNICKNHLDGFWVNQEFKFDWRADIAGIGSQSLNS